MTSTRSPSGRVWVGLAVVTIVAASLTGRLAAPANAAASDGTRDTAFTTNTGTAANGDVW
jgi:hypothetical protein